MRSGACLQLLHDPAVEGSTKLLMCLVGIPTEGGRGHVATGCTDSLVRVWQLESAADAALPAARPTHVLRGHTKAVECVVQLADQLATGSADASLRVWNMYTGECLLLLEGHQSPVTCILALRNGLLASGSADMTLRVWDPSTGECTADLRGHTSSVCCIVELGDARVVSASYDKTLCVWDIAKNSLAHHLEGHTAPVNCVLELNSGVLVSGAGDNTVCVWSGEPEPFEPPAT